MLSDTLAAHVAGLPFESIPSGTIDAARLALLDATGVMFAASGLSDEGAPFTALALAGGEGPSRLLGRSERAAPIAAAFANGALAHALDFEDAFDAAPCHPNASLVPAVLALAEARGATGRDLLAALAIGCDLSCRMALALRRPMEAGGWYPPPILGAFGAAAGAARLIGLDARRTRDALSLILCQATAPGEIKHSHGTTIRAVREAFPAQAAVQAALLAEAGVVGFERPIEGEGGFYRLYAGGEFDEETLTGHLGRRFYGEELSFKRWPACRGTHAYIEAALRLRERVGGDWRRIAHATVIVGDVQRMLVEPAPRKRAPATAIDAKFSIFYTVALALVRGEVGLDGFDAAARADPELITCAETMSAIHDPVRVPTAFGGIVELELSDCTRLGEEVPVPLGHPTRPIGRAAMVDKFAACLAEAAVPCEGREASALADRILTLDVDSDAAALLRRTGEK